jgi:hypothetical protein
MKLPMDKSTPFRSITFKHISFKKKNIKSLLMGLYFLSAITSVCAQAPYSIRSAMGNSVPSVSKLPNESTFTIQQCIGQGSAIGTFYKNGYVLRQGFMQPTKTTSSPKTTSKLQATIFPNPASENTSITLTEPINEPIMVNLFDICGKRLYCNNFPASQELKLNYQPLAPGIYIVEVSSGTQYFSTKLIKE